VHLESCPAAATAGFSTHLVKNTFIFADALAPMLAFVLTVVLALVQGCRRI
jgi:hypothetical protein